MAAYLGVSLECFHARYTRLLRDRSGLSLTERENHECVFLTDEGECRIQAVKPRQCRNFPSGWHFRDYQVLCAAAQAMLNENTKQESEAEWTPAAGLQAFLALQP